MSEAVELHMIKSDQGASLPEARAARRRVWVRAMAGEFVCTFIFFFCVMGASINFARLNGDPLLSVVAGSLVAAMTAIGVVYSFADVSGAHFNPAVTFATWLARKTSNRKSASYVAVQLLASIFAVLFLMAIFPDSDLPGDQSVRDFLVITPNDDSIWRVFFMEFMLTFCFITVIFMTVFENIEQREAVTKFKGTANSRGLTLYTTNPQSKTGFAPLAIGFAIGFLCFIGGGGDISGGVFNPARLFGPALLAWNWHRQWVYWLGELGGAACAALLSGFFVRLGSKSPTDHDEESAHPLDTPLLPSHEDE